MISTLACMLVLADRYEVGQKWHYEVTWHFTAPDIDLTDEESFDVEVSKVLAISTTLKISQKLTASIVDGMRIPTDLKAAPSVREWALSPTGSVAFMPSGRFPLEERVYRLLKGILPAPKGDAVREQNWSCTFEDDGLGMPKADLNAWWVKSEKDDKEYGVGYTEKNGTRGRGRFVRSPKMPFPSLVTVKFLNTKMSGGTDVVDCDLKMVLKPDKKL